MPSSDTILQLSLTRLELATTLRVLGDARHEVRTKIVVAERTQRYDDASALKHEDQEITRLRVKIEDLLMKNELDNLTEEERTRNLTKKR